MQSIVSILQSGVTEEMNGEICTAHSVEEICVALFQIYPTKSPGSNGMPPEFFQKY